jgi:hypothetical protein
MELENIRGPRGAWQLPLDPDVAWSTEAARMLRRKISPAGIDRFLTPQSLNRFP